MPSIDLAEIETLLQPVSDAEPGGADLRSSGGGVPLYRTMRDALADATAAERAEIRGGSATEPSQKSWGTAAKAAQDILRDHAKDMEVVAVLLQAVLRLDGFAGLTWGFSLSQGLVEHLWPHLHPRTVDDEDGPEINHGPGAYERAHPISLLDGEDKPGPLVAALLRQPLLDGLGSAAPQFWHAEAALKRKPAGEDEERRSPDGAGPDTAEIRATVTSLPASALRDRLAELVACKNAYAGMVAALDEACAATAAAFNEAGNEGSKARPYRVSSARITETLEACIGMFQTLTAGLIPEADAIGGQPAAAGPSPGAAAAPGGPTVSGRVASREEAFRQIESIAAYFEAAEPHSPVSFALRQAVRWGRMPLPALMRELMSAEATARDDYFRIIGIPRAEPEET